LAADDIRLSATGASQASNGNADAVRYAAGRAEDAVSGQVCG
jgi:hypothetical protein